MGEFSFPRLMTACVSRSGSACEECISCLLNSNPIAGHNLNSLFSRPANGKIGILLQEMLEAEHLSAASSGRQPQSWLTFSFIWTAFVFLVVAVH